MVTELVSVDAEVIRRINSVGYRGWFEVVCRSQLRKVGRGMWMFWAMGFKISGTEKQRSWKLTPTGSRRSCLLLPPSVSVTDQTTLNRPLLCAIERNLSFLLHTHPSQPIHLPWRGGSTFLRNVATFNHYVVLKPKRLSSQKIKDIEIATQLFSVWIMGSPPALIEWLNPKLQTSQSEPGLPRMLDTTHWRQVSSLFPKAPLAGSITRYVWQLNIVSLLVFHLHAHNGPGI